MTQPNTDPTATQILDYIAESALVLAEDVGAYFGVTPQQAERYLSLVGATADQEGYYTLLDNDPDAAGAAFQERHGLSPDLPLGAIPEPTVPSEESAVEATPEEEEATPETTPDSADPAVALLQKIARLAVKNAKLKAENAKLREELRSISLERATPEPTGDPLEALEERVAALEARVASTPPVVTTTSEEGPRLPPKKRQRGGIKALEEEGLVSVGDALQMRPAKYAGIVAEYIGGGRVRWADGAKEGDLKTWAQEITSWSGTFSVLREVVHVGRGVPLRDLRKS